MRGYQINWAMESIKVIDILVVNRATSQGKSSVFNGSFNFICEVKWTINLGTKVGKREAKNSFSNTYEQGGLKY